MWSRTGQVICSSPNCLRNLTNSSFTNTFSAIILILLGSPYCDMYCFRNSITFFVVGLCKKIASGHPEKWCTDTNKYFLLFLAFRRAPQNRPHFSHLVLLVLELFHFLFVSVCILNSYLIAGIVRTNAPDLSFPDVPGATICLLS